MFLVVINTILESVSEIFYKKSLLTSKLRPTVFQFLFEGLGLLFVIGMIVLLGFDFWLFLKPNIIAGFVILAAGFTAYNNIAQKLYREEKMAVLLPYFKINNFLIIIAGFLLYRDASVVSFIICFLALGLVVWGSYDPEQRALPKNLKLVMVHEILRTIEMLVIVYLLKRITSEQYMVLYQIFYLVIAFFVVLFLRELSDVKKLDIITLKYRALSYTLWFAWYYIDTLLLSEFGLIVATLFWFFWSSLSLALAYIMFREIPTKKEIFLWIALIVLVWVGYALR